jgi:hypothetical protein
MATQLITLNATKPQLRNEYDAIVAFLHLTLCEAGFRCTGLGEVQSNSNVKIDETLPNGWNQSQDAYFFQYRHTQSSMNFIVKYLVMSDKLLVHGLAKEDGKLCSLELSVKEYTNEKSLSDYNHLFKNSDKLVTLFKINILYKFIPDMSKPGYEAEADNSIPTQSRTQVVGEQDVPPPQVQPPVYDPLRIPNTGNHPRYPFGVGYNDLHPPFPGMGGMLGGHGNLMGPNHPSFGPRVNDPYANNFDLPTPGPRGRVPGARFDPVGPPANPLQPRFTRNDYGDELPPPGFDNMYL